MGELRKIKHPLFVYFFGFFFFVFVFCFCCCSRATQEEDSFSVFYVSHWMWPRGWKWRSAMHGARVPCNNANVELFLVNKYYFCHSFFYKFLIFFSVPFFEYWVWHRCLWEESKREVWIFRNKILLLNHPVHNWQNCDFPFHLMAVIVPEFMFSIKVQTDLFVFFSPHFFCLWARTTLSCSHIWMYTNMCVHPPYREDAI